MANRVCVLGIGCAAALPCGGALTGLPTVIFSNIQSSPTSDVPGIPGLKFSVPTQGSPFERPFGSPDGRRWAFRGLAAGGIMIAGAGTNGTDALVVARRNEPSFFDSGVTYVLFRSGPGINDAGSIAFSADTNAPTSSDEIVARGVLVGNGETPHYEFDLIAREGLPAPGLPPGVGYGSGAGLVHVLSDDRVAFGSAGLTGIGGDAVFINTALDDGQVLIQSGVTIPAQQVAGGSFALLYTDDFHADAGGANYLYAGRLTNGHDFIAFNNHVVAERLLPLPGGYPGVFKDPDLFEDDGTVSPYNGHYAFRCAADFDGGRDHVVVVDGRVVAATGDPIVPGSDINWRNGDNSSTPFVITSINSQGDYLIGGIGQRGPIPQGWIWVWNGTTIVRFGLMAVDLNGDGLGNDGLTLGDVQSDDAYLTDAGRIYFAGSVRNNIGQAVGEAFMWMPAPVRADVNCDGAIDFFDVDPFLVVLFDPVGYGAAYPECWPMTADLDRSGRVDFFDIDPFVNCLFGGCGVQAP